MPFEEWIYGKPPEDVEFVSINGNRVIRVEIAEVGKPPEIFTKDEVAGLMRTDGTPLAPDPPARIPFRWAMFSAIRTSRHRHAPPSLRTPGETLPADNSSASASGVMKPVQFPKQKPDDDPGAASGWPGSSRNRRGRQRRIRSRRGVRNRIHRSSHQRLSRRRMAISRNQGSPTPSDLGAASDRRIHVNSEKRVPLPPCHPVAV